MVPVVDLSRRGARFAAAFAVAAERVARSGHFLLGAELARFESAFADFTAAGHAVGVGSGASALQLGLAAIGVGPGDEVVVPAFTAVPTASAVAALGAVAVFADVDPDTACLDPESAARHITERTAAVVVVHLYGFPAEIPELGVPVVEDAAQAHGALDDVGRSALTAYSFYPTKNLGGIGDGGAVVTERAEIANEVRLLRVHGMSAEYVHDRVVQNFRMSEVEAAWLNLVLPELDHDLVRRRSIAARYRRAAPRLRWQQTHDRHVHHLCVFRTSDRDGVRDRLAASGVATAVHYPLAVTQQPAYRSDAAAPCPNAELWAAECVTVPCFPEMTDDEIDQVCAALAGVAG